VSNDDTLRRQITALQAENRRLRDENGQLAQQVLNLETQIADLQQQLARLPETRGVPVELLGAAIRRALDRADAALAEQTGAFAYTVADLDCDVKGFLVAAEASLAIRPAHALDIQAAESLSTVRLRVTKVPAGATGPR
jgi:hypothetical protein